MCVRVRATRQAEKAAQAADASGDAAQRVDARVHRGLAVLRTDGAHDAAVEFRKAVEMCETFWESRGSGEGDVGSMAMAENVRRLEAAEAAARSNLARACVSPATHEEYPMLLC